MFGYVTVINLNSKLIITIIVDRPTDFYEDSLGKVENMIVRMHNIDF